MDKSIDCVTVEVPVELLITLSPSNSVKASRKTEGEQSQTVCLKRPAFYPGVDRINTTTLILAEEMCFLQVRYVIIEPF